LPVAFVFFAFSAFMAPSFDHVARRVARVNVCDANAAPRRRRVPVHRLTIVPMG
jgi:hypothetical protein